MAAERSIGTKRVSIREFFGGGREPGALRLLVGPDEYYRYVVRVAATSFLFLIPVVALAVASVPRVAKYDLPLAVLGGVTFIFFGYALRAPQRLLPLGVVLGAALATGTATVLLYSLHRYDEPLAAALCVAGSVAVFAFLPRRVAALAVVGITGLYALHVWLSPWQHHPLARWIIIAALTVVVGLVTSSIVRRIADLAATERRLREELDEVNRHKSQFLANMSHELRTPLNAVIGFSDALSEELFGELNDKQKEYIGDIRSSGAHLLTLINDVLDLSKVEAGRMDLDRSWFDLNVALASCASMLRAQAERDGIELVVALEPSVGAVEADERKVRQVVVNLLSNALKFTPSGGRVVLSAERCNGEIKVAVADTGPGIPPEDQAHIFEEFRQARSARNARGVGTGLGLALARRFVELHGGRIAVTSAEGQGSTFTIHLPATTAT